MSSSPLRVLQLVDLNAGFQTARGAESLAREVGAGFEVVTRTLGLGGDYPSLLSAVARLGRDVGAGHHLIHAWGGRALAVAGAVVGKVVKVGGRIVHTLPDTPTPRSVRWLRAVTSHRDVHAVCASATVRRACVERGVPPDRCHTIRPGVEFARVRRRRDPELRRALGFGDGDRVMLLAGESTPAAGHVDALWAAAILHVLDPRYRVLAWGRGDRLGSLAHFSAGQGRPGLLRLAETHLGRSVEFEELLPAADLILATPRGLAATLPVSIAMAAALPIVATVSYTIGELLEDRHTALLAPPRSPCALAQRVLDLERDPNLQWSVSDMARTEAYEYFALTRFVNQYRAVYRQAAAGEKVSVPENAPGAGLRFHGRG